MYSVLDFFFFGHGQFEVQAFWAEHVWPLAVEAEPAAPAHGVVEDQLLVGIGQRGAPSIGAAPKCSMRCAVPKVRTMEMVVARMVSSSSFIIPPPVSLRPNLGILNFTFIVFMFLLFLLTFLLFFLWRHDGDASVGGVGHHVTDNVGDLLFQLVDELAGIVLLVLDVA